MLTLGWPLWALADDVSDLSRMSELVLTSTEQRYSITSLDHSSGFFPAFDRIRFTDVIQQGLEHESFGLSPNFREHERYWLYTHVRNETSQTRWRLHISNFGYLEPRVLIQNGDEQYVRTIRNAGFSAGTDINTIGRSIVLDLPPQQSITMVIELKAQKVAWQPYIGLMSEDHYQQWVLIQDLFYKPAIGIVLGFVLLGGVAWLLTRDATLFWGTLSALFMLAFHLEHSSLPALLWQSTYEKGTAFWLLAYATMALHLAFSGRFLDIHQHSERWTLIWRAMIATTLVLGTLSPFMAFETNMYLGILNYCLFGLFILGSGIRWVRAYGSFYIIYLAGWIPVILSLIQVTWIVQGSRGDVQVVDASYKMIQGIYIQIAHLSLHSIAVILRVRSLREAKLRAEALSIAKSRFMAQSSHDLAQPLHSMRVFLEYLKPHIIGSEGRKHFYRLQNTHRQLSENFDAIMDLSKLESGVIRPDFSVVHLSSLLSRLEQEYQGVAEEKGLHLKVQKPSVSVVSDPVLLERLIRNLLSNAIKYTDQGKVLIGCRRRGDSVVLQVADTGCGISVSAQKQIFDLYRRSSEGDIAGSGVGLAIVQHLSELLDHPIHLESTPKRGSVFSVTLPRYRYSGQSDTHRFDESSTASVQTAALVVSQSEDRMNLTERLKRWQFEIDVYLSIDDFVHSGKSASILVCDSQTLAQSSLSVMQLTQITQTTPVACISPPGSSLPESWTGLAPSAMVAQLRALLNALERSESPSADSALLDIR
ncbi:sensor histidine kinase [Reinekea blandensis]|nr:sensor histidine kinase [Reinekea blandensis]